MLNCYFFKDFSESELLEDLDLFLLLLLLLLVSVLLLFLLDMLVRLDLLVLSLSLGKFIDFSLEIDVSKELTDESAQIVN